jgi:hypothetical protein
LDFKLFLFTLLQGDKTDTSTLRSTMRVLFFLVTWFFLLSAPAYSQIEVMTAPEETVIGRISVALQMQFEVVKKQSEDRDSYFVITYKDYRYPNIYSLQSVIISNEETIQDLNRIIMEMFDNSDRNMELSFKLESETATLYKRRELGITIVTLWVYQKGYTNSFTRRQWERAFENL